MESERLSPSEFLNLVNGVISEELARAEQKVTPKQEEGLRFFYKEQTGSSSLAGKDVEGQSSYTTVCLPRDELSTILLLILILVWDILQLNLALIER